MLNLLPSLSLLTLTPEPISIDSLNNLVIRSFSSASFSGTGSFADFSRMISRTVSYLFISVSLSSGSIPKYLTSPISELP